MNIYLFLFVPRQEAGCDWQEAEVRRSSWVFRTGSILGASEFPPYSKNFSLLLMNETAPTTTRSRWQQTEGKLSKILLKVLLTLPTCHEFTNDHPVTV